MGMIKLPEASIAFFKSHLDEIFESGNLAEGPWNGRLTDHVKEYCGSSFAVPTASNGSGMMALLQIYKETDNRTKVLLQSNTMYGVKTLVKSAGLKVSGYIDCDTNTLMPGLTDVRKAVAEFQDRSSLIILLSHIGGIINPEIADIVDFCHENDIILLEDCAHSYGATWKGKHSGIFGNAGVYSFYATKAVPAGEGGIVVTNDETIGNAVKKYVIYDRFEQVMDIGVNIRQSEVQALLVYSVVKEVDHIIENKKEIASRYIEICNKLDIPYISQEDEETRGNYYKFIVLSKEGNISAYLPRLETTTSKVYDYCLDSTNAITENHACLPIWYGQSKDIADKVINELRACFKKNEGMRHRE